MVEYWDYQPRYDRPRRLRSFNYRQDQQYAPKGMWVTREHHLLRITAMSDNHLLSAIGFLERRAVAGGINEIFRIGRYVENAPEHAADAADECARELTDMMHSRVPEDRRTLANLVYPKHKELVAEANRRGLTLPSLDWVRPY